MFLPHPDDFKNYYSVDIEANGLDDATTVWCACVQNVGTGKEQSFVGAAAIKAWWASFPSDAFVVGHNFLAYDSPTLRRLVGIDINDDRIVDTLVLSYLYHPHLPGGHSLAAWGERFKYPKVEHEDWTKFSQDMLHRCVVDVQLTTRVFKALVERMRARGYSELSCWIEHKIARVIDNQQRRGFYFDVKRAKRTYDRLRKIEAHYTEIIHELFPPILVPVKTYEFKLKKDGTPYHWYDNHVQQYPKLEHSLDGTYTVYDWQTFNIGSPTQRVDRLLSLGWKPQKFTPKGNPQVDEESLIAFAKSSKRPEIQAIATYSIEPRIDHVGPSVDHKPVSDGRIHGKVFSCGAITRRMRHNAPNTANIPGNDSRFGRICRSLWSATPGRVLMGYDASALEMRMFGHYLGNKEAADLYIYGDPHTANAVALSAALDFVFVRRPVKTDFYAFLYGASNKKLGSHYGKSAKFGKTMRETLLNNTPGLKKLSDQIQAEAESGWIRTIDGGFVRSLSTHAALNSKLQSAGGIAMKLAAVLLDEMIQREGLDCWKVGDIHDEAQWDCHPDDAQRAGELALAALLEAGKMLKLSVPLEGEFKIGPNWSHTH